MRARIQTLPKMQWMHRAGLEQWNKSPATKVSAVRHMITITFGNRLSNGVENHSLFTRQLKEKCTRLSGRATTQSPRVITCTLVVNNTQSQKCFTSSPQPLSSRFLNIHTLALSAVAALVCIPLFNYAGAYTSHLSPVTRNTFFIHAAKVVSRTHNPHTYWLPRADWLSFTVATTEILNRLLNGSSVTTVILIESKEN